MSTVTKIIKNFLIILENITLLTTRTVLLKANFSKMKILNPIDLGLILVKNQWDRLKCL